MVILCGIDDSGQAQQAARAAAAIAKRAGEALELVHVQELFCLCGAAAPDGMLVPPPSQALLDADRQRMQAALEPLRDRVAQEFQVSVGLRFECGLPEWELARRAEELGASLIVVGATGRRSGSMWRLGSIADRLSQSAPVPVLVVRSCHAWSNWALEGRPLRVLVALATDPSAARAAILAADLQRLGPCELVEAHVYDPWREAQRLGLGSANDLGTRIKIERVLEHELARHLDGAGGEVHFVSLTGSGHVADVLVELAEKERADLIVIGSRDRGALERRFRGSVSYGVLGLAKGNVLVAREDKAASEAQAARGPRAPAAVRRVLAATDFSDSGNRAVGYALGLLPPGGQLILLHVLERPLFEDMALIPSPLDPSREVRRMDRVLAEAELRKLLPPQGSPAAEVEAVEATEVSEAILQSAERHDADLVVLGRRHGHGLGAALLGSSARAVARSSSRPVLLVPEDGAGA